MPFLAFRSLLGNLNPTPNPTVKRLSSTSWGSILHRSSLISDERYTPDWVLDIAVKLLGSIDLDPCADPLKRVPATNHYTKEQDGLNSAWAGRVFLNPPYSGAIDWFRHLCLYVEAGRVSESLVLVPVTSLGTKGASLLMRRTASAMTLFTRSLNFLDENYKILPSALPVPLALVYVGDKVSKFMDLTTGVGYGMIIHKPPINRKQFSCAYCGEICLASRSTAKFCGTTCRVEAHKKKVKLRSVI